MLRKFAPRKSESARIEVSTVLLVLKLMRANTVDAPMQISCAASCVLTNCVLKISGSRFECHTCGHTSRDHPLVRDSSRVSIEPPGILRRISPVLSQVILHLIYLARHRIVARCVEAGDRTHVLREYLSAGYGLQFSMEINGSKRFFTNTYGNIDLIVLFLHTSPKISGNLREFTRECNVGILYSSCLLCVSARRGERRLRRPAGTLCVKQPKSKQTIVSV